jgi:aminotransferase
MGFSGGSIAGWLKWQPKWRALPLTTHKATIDMPELANRTQQFKDSVIREMTRLAYRYQAINLAQGFPDFMPPPELIAAATQAMQEGYNQYSITWGTPRLRAALADKAGRWMGVGLDPEVDVTVTCGSTEAMMAALLAVCNPGDKVAVFSPFFENYLAQAVLGGAEALYIALRPPDFSFDPNDLLQAFEQGAKALILCNPSNPTGKVFSRAELETIAGLAREFDAIVITDEVYEHIVYAPNRHTYLGSLPGMFERTISCSSLSKTFSITGWRLGYVIAPPRLSAAVRKVHDYLTLGAPTPLQEAAATALAMPDLYYTELLEGYSRRRSLFLGLLEELGLHYLTPQGAFYVLVDIGRFGFPSDMDFAVWLVKNHGVAAVPASIFFREPVNRYIRLNFAKRAETLLEVARRLRNL